MTSGKRPPQRALWAFAPEPTENAIPVVPESRSDILKRFSTAAGRSFILVLP